MSRVLIIEDHALMRDTLCDIVSSLGVEHAIATTLTEGLQQLAQGTFQLILLDIHLPDADGMESIPLLQARGTPILLITGEGAGHLDAKAKAAGAQGCVDKAASLHTLRNAILNALD